MFQDQLNQTIQASRSNVAQSTSAPASANIFLSERAQLEKERRERQKRLRKAQGLPDSDDEQKIQNDEDEEGPSAKRQRLSSSSYAGQPNARSSTTSGLQSSSSKDPFFWDGEWRPTAVQGSEPREDGRPTFRLSEVLGSVSVELDEA